MIYVHEDNLVRVSIERTPEIEQKVTDAVIKWMHKYHAYAGECIMQSDAPIISAPEVLSDIVDEILKPEVEWKW